MAAGATFTYFTYSQIVKSSAFQTGGRAPPMGHNLNLTVHEMINRFRKKNKQSFVTKPDRPVRDFSLIFAFGAILNKFTSLGLQM